PPPWLALNVDWLTVSVPPDAEIPPPWLPVMVLRDTVSVGAPLAAGTTIPTAFVLLIVLLIVRSLMLSEVPSPCTVTVAPPLALVSRARGAAGNVTRRPLPTITASLVVPWNLTLGRPVASAAATRVHGCAWSHISLSVPTGAAETYATLSGVAHE